MQQADAPTEPCPTALTIEAAITRRWDLVLLEGKRPVGKTWITPTLVGARRHVEQGGNLGLICGLASGIAVLDWDDPDALAEIEAHLGPIFHWVRTGSGRFHSYVEWQAGLPAKITWRGRVVGEIQRGEIVADRPNRQQVVIPPSVHPVSRQQYEWLVDPVTEPLKPLPDNWLAYFKENARTIQRAPRVHAKQPVTKIERMRALALQQPGARLRHDGIKFACPACVIEGHDHHQDNAKLFDSGRVGCAYAAGTPYGRNHRRQIMRALGALYDPTKVQRERLRGWRNGLDERR